MQVFANTLLISASALTPRSAGRLRSGLLCLLTLVVGLCGVVTKPAIACNDDGYLVGAARDDITGPIAEVGMMGYADLGQVDEGLHMRLYSRALAVADPCREKTVALVIADLGMVFHGLKAEVVKRLKQQLPGVFSFENIMFSATHTHAGPGGFAHHALYNITTLGFNPSNFEAIASGTTRAIVNAYQRLQPGRLLLARGELKGVQFNRSPTAYLANPASERARYGGASDPGMVLLKAVSKDGHDLAAFNWFPVHGVSLPLENKLVSGDNKGLAAYLMEQRLGADVKAGAGFVAGFVQANAGDISPYDVSGPDGFKPRPPADGGFGRNTASGQAQYKTALALYEDASEPVSGPLQFAHKFSDLVDRSVDPAYTHQGPQHTCNAALGVSFAAGTRNGQPVSLFKQGTVYGRNWPAITMMPREQECQAEKVVLLPTGYAKPDPWTARVAPFQIIRLGQLAIIATPFEITTMAGRRLKEQILNSLASEGVTDVVISALANEYLHYVTTREEYAAQAYEGGSTLYGPWSLAAYTEIFDSLALAIRDARHLDDEAQPLDLSHKQVTLRPGVVFDAPPVGRHFGEVKTPPIASYPRGAVVDVEFWGAHPNNAIEANQSYLSVEQASLDPKPSWRVIRHDWDPDTTLHWRRSGLASSVITIKWQLGEEVEPGTYRICHRGKWKAFVTGNLRPYSGCSRPFTVDH